MNPTASTPHRRSGWWLPIIGILLVAINLRPAVTAVGPILPTLGEDLALDESSLGLLSALPIAVFAITSPMVQALVQRIGVERTTVVSLTLLTFATVLRSWPGPDANVWIGTVLIGAAIAVGNVTVPVIVKQAFPKATALITGIYVAVLGIFAGLSAALAVPIAAMTALTWRLSLGVWAGLTVIGLLFWMVRAARTPRRLSQQTSGSADPTKPDQQPSPVWKRAMTWQISAYMGVQSSVFYVSLTWLPTVEQDLGVDPVAAGWHMFIFQVAGVAGNLLAPALMRVGGDQRIAAMLPGLLFLTGVGGLFLAPSVVVLWMVILGFGTGNSFVVALSLIASRAADVRTASRVSALAQSIGYAIAALSLFSAGLVQGWNSLAVLLVIAVAAILTFAMGAFVGRHQLIGNTPSVDEVESP